MSCFMVERDTLRIIIEGIVTAYHKAERDEFCDILNGTELDGHSLAWDHKYREKFARQLHQMNGDSVYARYQERVVVEKFDGLGHGDGVTPHQFLRSLHCYLYQGDGERECWLYRQLEIVAANLARNIAIRTPEYMAAKWE